MIFFKIAAQRFGLWIAVSPRGSIDADARLTTIKQDHHLRPERRWHLLDRISDGRE
jgi:hypothetical protein